MNLAKKLFGTTVKNRMIFMLSILAAFGVFQTGVKHTLPQVCISIFTAVVLDFLIVYFKSKKVFFSTSAVISGLIVALLLFPGVAWYIVVSTSLTAILSKHLIRIKGKHIFNPASFGLLMSMFIFNTYMVWWGAGNTWLVLLLGVFIAYRFKRFHLILSYLITQSVLLGIIFAFKGQPLINAVLMANLFFMFVMLVEPMTSPIKRNGRIIYGIVTGIFSSTFLLIIPSYDPSILALACANLFVPIINKTQEIKR